jgi:hypothetical protein
VALTPGFLRSEAMLARFGVTEANWEEGAQRDRHFAHSETPCYVGRAVAALAADPGVHAKSAGVFASWTLAREYGFRDVDGRQPDWGAYWRGVIKEILERGAIERPDDRFLLEVRYYQIHLDPASADEARRISELLARGDRASGPLPPA